MFKVSFFIEDTKLGEALKRLAGLARNLEHSYVPNVEPEKRTNGKLKVKGNNAVELIIKELRHRKAMTFNATVFQSIIGDLGLSATAYSYYLQKAAELGLITKHRGKGTSGFTYTLKGDK